MKDWHVKCFANIKKSKDLRVLLIGSDYEWSIENKFIRELHKIGFEVSILPAQNWFYKYYYKNIFNKVLFRSGLSLINQKINYQLIKKVSYFNPDIIWVFKGMEVLPSTLKKWKNLNIKLVNYNPDNPFIFTGRGSGNKNVTNSIDLYDLHLSYDHQVLNELKNRGLKCAFFPFAIDINLEPINEELTPIDKLAFVGNPDNQRVAFMNDLAHLGVPLVVFGNNWDKFKLDESIEINGPVDATKFQKIARNYRAMLNIMRIHNPDSHNMRSLEIPGFGGIQLASRTKDHQTFYLEGKEVFLFDDAFEAKEKWKALMKMTNLELLKLRNSAVQRVKSVHSYEQRALEFKNLINELNAN